VRFFKAATAIAVAAFAVGIPATAGAADHATTALNIIPSGQLETGQDPTPYPFGAFDVQAKMYNALTPLYRNVTPSDLTPDKYFKSETLPSTLKNQAGAFVTTEAPKSGVSIKRTKYAVPYVYGTTDDDVTWGAGWVAASDRLLLLKQARYIGLTAAVGVPGVSAIDLLSNLGNFAPSKQTVDIVNKQTQAILAQGKRGKQLLHDIDVYLEGINAWVAKNDPTTAKFTRTDIYAINAIKGQFLGQGGGAEVQNADMYDLLTQKFGAKRGRGMWNDFRSRNDPDSEVTYKDGSAPYQSQPKTFKGNVGLVDGSFKPAINTSGARKRQVHLASNVLLVSGNRTSTGHPLFVGGPQIGYFFPGLTYEIGLSGPHRDTVGATSAPFPGYMLIGRAGSFAWTLTSAGSDIIDTYAETLCGGSKTKYLYKGKCLKMGTVKAGTISQGTTKTDATFRTTVHGPVQGYAMARCVPAAKKASSSSSGSKPTAFAGAACKNKLVALTQRRSSYGRDTVDQLYNQALTDGSVKSFADYKKAASLTPQTFNSFYADDKHIGFYTSGLLPLRKAGSTGDLPIDGRGKYEWTGFLSTKGHAQGEDPKSGIIVNWNNKPQKNYPASDERWDEAPIQRVQMLLAELNRHTKNTLATVTGAMNAAATNDVRGVVFWPVLRDMLAKGTSPSARDTQMVAQLQKWHDQGSTRLDTNHDGKMDSPGPAIMDAMFTDMARAALCGRLTNKICQTMNDEIAPIWQSSGQYGGWHQYMLKDFKTLLHQKVKQKYSSTYCGKGSVTKCAKAMWSALDAAGNKLASSQGSDPANWRGAAGTIEFGPLSLITMDYTNRPSGIQQVISFNGSGR
jgi:acyl-homoserine lactone acylase PvdQ